MSYFKAKAFYAEENRRSYLLYFKKLEEKLLSKIVFQKVFSVEFYILLHRSALVHKAALNA